MPHACLKHMLRMLPADHCVHLLVCCQLLQGATPGAAPSPTQPAQFGLKASSLSPSTSAGEWLGQAEGRQAAAESGPMPYASLDARTAALLTEALALAQAEALPEGPEPLSEGPATRQHPHTPHHPRPAPHSSSHVQGGGSGEGPPSISPYGAAIIENFFSSPTRLSAGGTLYGRSPTSSADGWEQLDTAAHASGVGWQPGTPEAKGTWYHGPAAHAQNTNRHGRHPASPLPQEQTPSSPPAQLQLVEDHYAAGVGQEALDLPLLQWGTQYRPTPATRITLRGFAGGRECTCIMGWKRAKGEGSVPMRLSAPYLR